MEFRVDQVDLTEVGLARVTRDSRTMLDRLAQMRIPLYSSPGEEPDAPLIQLGKGVCWAAAHGLNSPTHRLVSPSQGGVASFGVGYTHLLRVFYAAGEAEAQQKKRDLERVKTHLNYSLSLRVQIV
jgi:hypothetical protein